MLFSILVRLLFAMLPVLAAQASRIELTPLVVTTGDPDDDHYRTPLGTGYDGIAALTIDTGIGEPFGCTGSLLSTGYLLTAAHCLTDATGTLNVFSLSATFFPSSGGTEVIAGNAYVIHPAFTGALEQGADIGIVVLANRPSAGVQRYDLYEGTGEIGSTYEFAGWGRRGTGETGATSTTAARRRGWNTFDATMAETFGEFDGWTAGDTVLVSDFDSGRPENDALRFFYEDFPEHLGLGFDEASIAPGDSGAPAFIDGKIAGIASFRQRLEFDDGETSDIDAFSNGSFGEFNAFTRISSHSRWIYAVPEPSTVALCAAFAVMLAGRSVARRRKSG
jgi:hypothetical protein